MQQSDVYAPRCCLCNEVLPNPSLRPARRLHLSSAVGITRFARACEWKTEVISARAAPRRPCLLTSVANGRGLQGRAWHMSLARHDTSHDVRLLCAVSRLCWSLGTWVRGFCELLHRATTRAVLPCNLNDDIGILVCLASTSKA